MKIYDYWNNPDLKNYGKVVFLEDSELNSPNKLGQVFGKFCLKDFKVIENAYYVFYYKNDAHVEILKAFDQKIVNLRTPYYEYVSLEIILDCLKDKIQLLEWSEMVWDLYGIEEST